ncbi:MULTISPECIES: DUF4224 domain-containing protein [Klebsiella/Raoultella group]|jgi:hypothetical protein|uniref:DUF4224 domain-containing protein n=1 Tax=Klebsiella michiganensis TaxID=1134687 RepID=A0A1Q8YNP8_9ENTR|nr:MULTISPECIES: DUF4224 domain-containing protein [Klebsiella]MDM9674044.1 DUF4224 domain-containing protein [Raoultella planticola]DAI63436.1 MAG TPA: protein of unknown function (DUF4224) [Caudoviricetes sp.]HBT2404192.1 DUF4224 domain-containing protein [Klebsiella pneumoniae subsp. pneumoniae]HCI4232630.1 DUF4224 domain-containing protein [Klebsiella quasipneumoniae subsp. similipneumoniae]HCU1807666.1 DUF4224 domain-containing protein [Klebsiella aerogenes]
MRHDHDIITREEMIELTGTPLKSRQCEALRRAGVFFMERADGHPKTTWGHFLNPIKYRNQQEETVREEEPDFGAIFNGRKT